MYCAQSQNIQKSTLSVQFTDNNWVSKDFLTSTISNLIVSAYIKVYDYKVLDYFELSFEKATMQHTSHDLDGIHSGLIERIFVLINHTSLDLFIFSFFKKQLNFMNIGVYAVGFCWLQEYVYLCIEWSVFCCLSVNF